MIWLSTELKKKNYSPTKVSPMKYSDDCDMWKSAFIANVKPVVFLIDFVLGMDKMVKKKNKNLKLKRIQMASARENESLICCFTDLL